MFTHRTAGQHHKALYKSIHSIISCATIAVIDLCPGSPPPSHYHGSQDPALYQYRDIFILLYRWLWCTPVCECKPHIVPAPLNNFRAFLDLFPLDLFVSAVFTSGKHYVSRECLVYTGTCQGLYAVVDSEMGKRYLQKV